MGGGGAVGCSDRGDDGVRVAGAVEEREEHADDGGGRKPLSGLAYEEDADAADRAYREVRGDPEAALSSKFGQINPFANDARLVEWPRRAMNTRASRVRAHSD